VQVLLDEQEINRLIHKLAVSIAASVGESGDLALVGIRSRGDILAQRLQRILQEKGYGRIDRGTLDITLYRDDLNSMGHQQPKLQSTEIDFSVDDRMIVLVDDVLNTGRSTRAAMEALIALGRPRCIRLAVLIDRGERELPIRADYVGKVMEVPPDRRVQVYLKERDGRDEVVLG
jgi:pyrimidine operon attenuation protein/uracil phosphoribosyltransferase